MLGIILFLQLVLTYQVMSFNSGSVSTGNGDKFTLKDNKLPGGKQEL
jgi:hypothetical protein